MKGRVAQLLQGFENLDRMKLEIDRFMEIVAYFVSTAPLNLSDKGCCIFLNNGYQWTFNVSTRDLDKILDIPIKDWNKLVTKAIISYEIGNSIFDRRQVYQYDLVKHKLNRQPNIEEIQNLHDSLEFLEESLDKKFGKAWLEGMQHIIQASY